MKRGNCEKMGTHGESLKSFPNDEAWQTVLTKAASAHVGMKTRIQDVVHPDKYSEEGQRHKGLRCLLGTWVTPI